MPIRLENCRRYGADWRQFSRRIRFERAGGRCECRGECGRASSRLDGDGRCRNRHGHPATRIRTGEQMCLDGQPAPGGDEELVVLTVAHRNHVPEQRGEGEVFAACQSCHLHYDIDHHRQTRERTRAAKLAVQQRPLFTINTPAEESE